MPKKHANIIILVVSDLFAPGALVNIVCSKGKMYTAILLEVFLDIPAKQQTSQNGTSYVPYVPNLTLKKEQFRDNFSMHFP